LVDLGNDGDTEAAEEVLVLFSLKKKAKAKLKVTQTQNATFLCRNYGAITLTLMTICIMTFSITINKT
jgi:hypothetical protein